MNGGREPKPTTVRYVRTTRADTNDYVLAYVRSGLRQDLRRAGPLWPMVLLQLWSALHPDPAARSTKPVADARRYVQYLVGLAQAGGFRTPPRIAAVRRDQARTSRRAALVVKRASSHVAPRTIDGAAELAKIMSTLGATTGTIRRIGG